MTTGINQSGVITGYYYNATGPGAFGFLRIPDTLAPPTPSVVFMGDSITRTWITTEQATHPSWINAGSPPGVANETTTQMLARFQQDVIDVHPDVVNILAGTFDMAATSWTPPCGTDTCNNIVSMLTLAHNAGIKVLIGTLPITTQGSAGTPLITANPDIQGNENLFNRNLGLVQEYWQEDGLVDFASVLAPGWTDDGVNPNEAGSLLLTTAAEQAVTTVSSGAIRQAPEGR